MVPGRRYNVRYALRTLRQSWWMALVPLLGATALAAVIARALPNVYYAQTTIVIVPQRIPESYVRSTVTVSLAERLQSTSEHVLSRTRLEQLINQFDVFPTLRGTVPMEALVAWFRRGIRVQLVRGDAFIVGYGGYDAEQVQKIADHLATLFIRESLREREMLADSTSQFLEAELTAARERLRAQEHQVEEFRRRYSGELPNQLDANLRIIQSTSVQLQSISEALQRDRDRREELASELSMALSRPSDEPAGSPPAPAPPSGDTADDPGSPIALPAGPVSVQLRAARATRQRLLQRLTPEHPDVKAIERVIANLERAAAGQPVPESSPKRPEEPAVSPRVAQLREMLRVLDDQIASREAAERRLRDSVTSYQARVEAVPEREAEWVQLTRDYNTLQAVYADLLAKREQSRIAANLERQQVGEQFRIVERPVVPTRPISPKRPTIVLGGLAIGLAIGLGLLILRELRDHSFRAEEEIAEALKLPVVGLVPVITTAWDRRRARRRRVLWSAAALLLCVGVAALRLVR
jgi:polysaccharide chain length determinant protein (PEP-CTERM system associated)